jgi:hypothetical protein
MALYAVLLRCTVETDEATLAEGETFAALGRTWRVDEVIAGEPEHPILLCTLHAGHARPTSAPGDDAG